MRNHKDDIAAMDLFTVPTVSLRLLYGFFIIEHGRRRILHFNATFHPTAAWVIQQLRDAFPYNSTPRYLIFDRDSIFSSAVTEFIKAMGTKPVRISYRSPWQNGTAERWILSCRRELLEHVVIFGERHLVRFFRSYIRIAAIWDSKKVRPTSDRSPRDDQPPRRLWHYRGWADSTTAMPGQVLLLLYGNVEAVEAQNSGLRIP